MVHFAQIINSKEFRKYDKGAEQLRLSDLYEEREKPDLIPYQSIDGRVPIYLFAGAQDETATVEEALWISSNVAGVKSVTVVDDFEHNSFMYDTGENVEEFHKNLFEALRDAGLEPVPQEGLEENDRETLLIATEEFYQFDELDLDRYDTSSP